ncbi:MAG: radical SAM protein [bacterium]|nr:radical SAM protein [bacterium]
MQLPQYLNLLPSYLCNARCQICNIWQKNPETQRRKSDELTIPFYRELFNSPWLKELRHISISGGEPFLYPQLVELIQLIPTSVVVTIATNAAVPMLLIHPFLPQLANRDKLYLQISIDGAEQSHNQLRGIPIAYQTALELIIAAQNYSIPFYFSMVINTVNYAELDAVYSLAKKYDTFVQFNPIHPGDYYQNPELKELTNWTQLQILQVEEQLERIIPDSRLRGNDPRGGNDVIPAKAGITPEEIAFYQQIPNYLRHQKIEVPECYAGRIAIYLDPYGSIFPCPVYWKEMGNIKEQNPLTVWNSAPAERVRQEIAKLGCGGCWHICQIPLNLWLSKSK